MLPSVNVLKNQILNLQPQMTNHQGAVNLIDVIADFMNQVQAGSGGSAGIFTFSRAPAVAILETQQPVLDNSWITNFANAIEAGVLAGSITPNTVTNAAWLGSGTDVATLPSPAATITTLAPAKAVLIAALAPVVSDNNPPMPLAQAIDGYTRAFTFLCIGLGVAPVFVPIPIPFAAQ